WSPRVGINYDYLGNGRAKFFGSFSRTYELVPLGIWNRSAPTERSVNIVRSICNPQSPNVSNPTYTLPTSACQALVQYQVAGASQTMIQDNMQGQFVDRIEFGHEFQVTSDFLVGLNYTNSRMGIVIEDYSTNDGQSYYIGNPGPLPPGTTAHTA